MSDDALLLPRLTASIWLDGGFRKGHDVAAMAHDIVPANFLRHGSLLFGIALGDAAKSVAT